MRESSSPRRSFRARLRALWTLETAGLLPRLHAVMALERLLPVRAADSSRASLLRAAGFSIGAGARLHAMPRITGNQGLERNLAVGPRCEVGAGCTLDLQERITLGEEVTMGERVMILTSTHELGPHEHRAGAVTRSPVSVGDRARLGAGCVILPGVTIGADAVVEPAAVVNKDVAPGARVAGVPARPVVAEVRG